MSLRLKKISANDVRVPRTDRGEATLVERYGKERAVVLHPEDYRRLCELEALVEEAARLAPVQLSEEAIRAHREEGTPDQPLTDVRALAKLFG